MFDIFADKYYEQLFKFLSANNKDLLILLTSYTLKRQENVQDGLLSVYD
jgi:hypothetical protein